jgi:hypothetical protein
MLRISMPLISMGLRLASVVLPSSLAISHTHALFLV